MTDQELEAVYEQGFREGIVAGWMIGRAEDADKQLTKERLDQLVSEWKATRATEKRDAN